MLLKIEKEIVLKDQFVKKVSLFSMCVTLQGMAERNIPCPRCGHIVEEELGQCFPLTPLLKPVNCLRNGQVLRPKCS